MDLENMSISEIKESIAELKKYKKLVLNVGEGNFTKYKDILIRKRIEEYPHESIEKILNIADQLYKL